MEPRMVMLQEFKVIGISARTSNEHEMKGNGKIPELWTSFQKERLLEGSSGRVDSSTVAVYTDYESDENGLYTLVIGGKVDLSGEVPNNLTSRIVPSGKYLVFTTPKGLLSKVVLETWMYIWDWFPKSELKRTYIADFELYDERSKDPLNSQVDIYIGLG